MEGTSLHCHQWHILTFDSSHTLFCMNFSYEKCQILDWSLVNRWWAISTSSWLLTCKAMSRDINKFGILNISGYLLHLNQLIPYNLSEARRRNLCFGSNLKDYIKLGSRYYNDYIKKMRTINWAKIMCICEKDNRKYN